MAAKLEVITLEQITTASESLQKVATALAQTALEMGEFDMESLRLPWSQRQWDAIELVITLGAGVTTHAPNQYVAHKLKRPSMQEKTMKRTAKDRATREEKRENGGKPVRKPGRQPKAD